MCIIGPTAGPIRERLYLHLCFGTGVTPLLGAVLYLSYVPVSLLQIGAVALRHGLFERREVLFEHVEVRVVDDNVYIIGALDHALQQPQHLERLLPRVLPGHVLGITVDHLAHLLVTRVVDLHAVVFGTGAECGVGFFLEAVDVGGDTGFIRFDGFPDSNAAISGGY